MSVVNQAAWGECADPRRTLAGAGQIPLGDHPRAGTPLDPAGEL